MQPAGMFYAEKLRSQSRQIEGMRVEAEMYGEHGPCREASLM